MKKLAIAWLEALKSGKYKQGKGKLGNDEMGYCCWGLGCKLAKIDYDPTDGWNGRLADKMFY